MHTKHRVKIPTDLLRQVKQATEMKSDAAVVTFALEELLRVKRQQRAVLSIFDLAREREFEELQSQEVRTQAPL